MPIRAFGPGSDTDYIADNLAGSIRRIAIPDDRALRAGLADVLDLAQHEQCRRIRWWREERADPARLYVIKENRSYDEVLGISAPPTGTRRWSSSAST